jgi:multiple sugar transport system ATP-binding protein
MPDEFLQLRAVTKRFGDTTALREVTLDVGPGELLVVLGPTGAGKTTLLRTIAGLETADSGTVLMAGRDVSDAPPAERDVALVFQNFSIYPDRTVRGNLEFSLRAPPRPGAAKPTKQEIADRVAWAAKLLRIEELLDRPASRLSGGQMQRVAIGRAIVRRPRLFLMDEPLTNLDAKLRESLRVELVLLQRTLKTPMVYVTHDQAEALSMGDRVVVLDRGRVLQTGTPREIYERPASPVVARQLGQPKINLLAVTSRGGVWMTAGGWPVATSTAADGARATAGVRAEDIDIDGGSVDARVVVVEDTGPTLQLLCQLGDDTFHVLAPKGAAVRAGDTVRPRVKPAAAVVWEG